MENNRRDFIRIGALAAGSLSLAGFPAFGKNAGQPPDPEPLFLNEEFHLWAEGSSNNGQNPHYLPKVRVYYPAGVNKSDKKLACVLICPGGGYHVQAPHEGEPFARLFALHGIMAAVLTYRVFPDGWPGPYADACRAMRMLRDRSEVYHLDPNKVAIMGFSAGGHLASTVASQPDLYREPEDDLSDRISARPDRLVLGYPVISLVDDFAHKGSANALLGENADHQLLRQLSNNYQVTTDNPPVFLFHTADDKGVPVQNSLRFAEACLEKNVPVELHVFPKGNHGVGMALDDPSLKIWTENLLGFFHDWV